MCEVKSREKRPKTKKKQKYSDQQQKEMNSDEPYSAPNEKTQPIQWTQWPTGALVAVDSFWPNCTYHCPAFTHIYPNDSHFGYKQKFV
jgi:hypothetical protein